MIESTDNKTGIVRHEISTMSPDTCRNNIVNTGYVTNSYQGNRVTRYLIDFKGTPIEIRVSPARAVLFSPNRMALLEFEKIIYPEEWEYENATQNDYVKTKKELS